MTEQLPSPSSPELLEARKAKSLLHEVVLNYKAEQEINTAIPHGFAQENGRYFLFVRITRVNMDIVPRIVNEEGTFCGLPLQIQLSDGEDITAYSADSGEIDVVEYDQ